jgi:hypothetical protein
MCARLSLIAYDHINFLGRYAFSRADLADGLRPFHDGSAEVAAGQPGQAGAGDQGRGFWPA